MSAPQILTQTIQSKPKTEMSEGQMFNVVLIHCLFIIVSPILTFFVFNFFLLDLFGLDSMTNNIYSAFAAVVVLHVALGNFIYRAYKQSEAVPGFDKLDKED